MMEKIEFSTKWIKWIKECIMSISYNILVNGSLVDRITPTRGIRQGYPIFPPTFPNMYERPIS